MPNPYTKLRDAAKKYADAVTRRKTILAGTYAKDVGALNAIELKGRIRAAASLGYETHVRIVDDVITLYNVARLPPTPWELT